MTSRKDRFTDNRLAFEEIIGNPFAYPEPIVGKYGEFHSQSIIRAMDNEFGIGRATVNPARPSVLDFFCDVEHAIETGLTRYQVSTRLNLDLLKDIFDSTYISEDSSRVQYTQKERTAIEQIIGRIFLQRSISPVVKYFLTMRRKAK